MDYTFRGFFRDAVCSALQGTFPYLRISGPHRALCYIYVHLLSLIYPRRDQYYIEQQPSEKYIFYEARINA